MPLAWAVAVATLATQDAPAVAETAADASVQESASGSVTVYEPSFFDQYRPQTALDMIERVPGFNVESGGGGGGGGRGPGGGGGGGGNRGFGEGGNVLINSTRPASKSDSLQDVLRRIPAASVVRIELIRGSAPGIDMQGKAVVVNVVREGGGGELTGAIVARTEIDEQDGDISGGVRIEAQQQLGVHLFEGVFNYGRNKGDGSPGRTRRVNGAGSLEELYTSTGAGTRNDYQLTGSYQGPILGGDLRLTLVAEQDADASTSEDRYIFGGPPVELGGGASESESREYGAQFTRDIFGGIEFEGSALYQEGERVSQRDLGSYVSLSSQETTEAIARGILRFPSIGSWTFDASSEIAKNTLDTNSELLLNGVPVNVFLNPRLGVEEIRSETSVNARWQVIPTVRLELGARYESSEVTTTVAGSAPRTLSFFKPRVLVSWTPTRAQQLSLRVEQEVSQLSFGNFTTNAQLQSETFISGNANIVPDQTMVYDARYQWRSGRASFSIQYTFREREDVIDRRRVVQIDDDTDEVTIFEFNDNVGSGRFHSYSLNATVPTDRFGVSGGLLSVRLGAISTELTDDVTGESRRFSGPPSFDWRINFTQDLPERDLQWGFTLNDQARSFSYQPNALFVREGGTFAEIFTEYRITPTTTIRAEIRNLLDNKFLPTRTVYAEPDLADYGGDEDAYIMDALAPRVAGQIDYIDSSVRSNGRTLFLSLRRNF